MIPASVEASFLIMTPSVTDVAAYAPSGAQGAQTARDAARLAAVNSLTNFLFHLLMIISISMQLLNRINCLSNVVSHILAVKVNPFGRLVGVRTGLFEIASERCHTQYAATACDDLAFFV